MTVQADITEIDGDTGRSTAVEEVTAVEEDTAVEDAPQPRKKGPTPSRPTAGGNAVAGCLDLPRQAHDLSDWIAKHPGGEFFIGRTKNRDITSIIGSYHKDPDRIERMLGRYALDRDAKPEDVHPTNNAPEFLFNEGFDTWSDTPKYEFDNKNDLLHRIKARLKEPALAARLKRMDTIFNVVVAVLAILYFGVQGLRLAEPGWIPLPVFVIAMVLLRSSLAGFGHYAIHRAQKGWTKVWSNSFDINYIALAFVTADGHTLLHHPHTQSDVDVKKNVFTMMMRVPRLYRVPIHTLHKFGHMFSGMTLRLLEVCKLTRKVGVRDMYGTWRGALPHLFGAFGMRFLLFAEFVAFTVAGDFWAWALQFVAALWISTFLVVSSHDFRGGARGAHGVRHRRLGRPPARRGVRPKDRRQSLPDCFLSAGLSSHGSITFSRFSAADSPISPPRTSYARRPPISASNGCRPRASSPTGSRSCAGPTSWPPPTKPSNASGALCGSIFPRAP